jgi:hypothetical protein
MSSLNILSLSSGIPIHLSSAILPLTASWILCAVPPDRTSLIKSDLRLPFWNRWLGLVSRYQQYIAFLSHHQWLSSRTLWQVFYVTYSEWGNWLWVLFIQWNTSKIKEEIRNLVDQIEKRESDEKGRNLNNRPWFSRSWFAIE